MNKFKFYIVAAVLASGMTLTSCGDSFLNPDPASKGAAGAAGDPMNINSGLAAAYQILLLDSYAGGSYESSVYIGDIQSDDLWKGGGDARPELIFIGSPTSRFIKTWRRRASSVSSIRTDKSVSKRISTSSLRETITVSTTSLHNFTASCVRMLKVMLSFSKSEKSRMSLISFSN